MYMIIHFRWHSDFVDISRWRNIHHFKPLWLYKCRTYHLGLLPAVIGCNNNPHPHPHYPERAWSYQLPVPYFIRTACRMAKLLQKPHSLHLQQQNWGAISDNFCNFLKQTIQHSHPPYTLIAQLRKKPGFELSLSGTTILSLFMWTNVCNTMNVSPSSLMVDNMWYEVVVF